MEVWIIRDGEKIGPFHDFEIRTKIASREVTGDTVGWHEGLAAWKPLREIPVFEREFDEAPRPPKTEKLVPGYSPAPDGPPGSEPPPLPRKLHLMRRFWARWLDMTFYCGIWWMGMWAAGQNIEGAMLNVGVLFLQYVPWFVFETLLITYRGTTPGKWLLGLRVVNEDGSLLDLGAATKRSARILFTGVGFGFSWLAVFCQALSYFTTQRLGKPLWDYTGGHRVEATELQPFRVAALVMLFYAGMHMKLVVQTPVLLRFILKDKPEMREFVEQWPLWYLPERHKK